MQIGKHVIKNKLVLAPMAGVSDRPFRILCRKLGAGMAVSEMVGANSFLASSSKTIRRANLDGEHGVKSVQLVGTCPKKLSETAKYTQDIGADIIDINMGCPAKKVCNVYAGSALLKDEKQVASIIESIVAAVSVPVTLKIRTGWDTNSRNGLKIAKIAENSGIAALSVHGRTRACKFRGQAEYDTIALIKDNIKIPVIANGDIISEEKAKYVLDYTKADAIMIGRAAQGNPWIFGQIEHFLLTGKKQPKPEVSVIKNVLLDHLDNLYSFYGEDRAVHIVKKHVGWYTKGLPGSCEFRSDFNKSNSAQAQYKFVSDFLGMCSL